MKNIILASSLTSLLWGVAVFIIIYRYNARLQETESNSFNRGCLKGYVESTTENRDLYYKQGFDDCWMQLYPRLILCESESEYDNQLLRKIKAYKPE